MTTPRCADCGRRLRDPASIARGRGPTCYRAAGGQPDPRPDHFPAPAPSHHIPGQTEIPIPDQQPALWETR
ncbi:DUF6011 domain-containing protein [Streptomyces sp. NPDC005878]|uniref:DUF6011 domain-containing protein n=1 Tax=Streptomyces sp. NPDC005878 TaxID=3157077 RepID=UPI0033FB0341